jgi:acetyl esterase
MAGLPFDPELLEAQKKAAEIAASLGAPEPGVEGVRKHAATGRVWWNEGGPEMADHRHLTIPGPFRDIPVVLCRPTLHQSLPVYVFLHGGAYRIGNEWSNDRQMRELAHDWGGAVVSMDYAHVPEDPFPKAVEECQAVLQWLNKNGASWGLDGDRIAFGGASAGSNVATGAAIGLGGVETGYLKAGLTVVGVLDRDPDTDSMHEFADADIFPSRAGIGGSLADYLPDPATRNDPRANPIAADPALFPPMFLAAAEIDVLRDSSKRLAVRLASVGVEHELKIYPGMTHLFFGYTRMVAKARDCVSDMAAFLRKHLPVEGV